jgi:uncharacterized protein YndB with AHSA1/START domain
MDDLPRIERNVKLPADPAEVWAHIVTGDLAEEWLGVRIDPRKGGRVVVPGRDIIGTVEDVIEGESITWSWRDVEGEPSQVIIEIGPVEGGGTRVTIVEELLEYRISGAGPFVLDQAA